MRLYFVITLCILSISSFCQINATTDEGKKVILNKNGTWKYVEEKKQTPPSLKVSFSKNDDSTSIPKNSISSASENRDCSKYVSVEVDKFTGDKIVSGKSYIVITSKSNSKEGFKIVNMMAGKDNDNLVCNITAIGSINCVDKGDKGYFVCSDGTKFNLAHGSDFNCKGDFTFYFGGLFGNTTELGYLSSKKITAIRLETNNSIQDVDLSDEQSTRLFNEINCLLKYMH